jgi:predicted nucleotidyltransferase
MNRDFVEMLSALTETGAEFLVVGAHALAAHGVARATGDLDIWVKGSSDNAKRVLSALEKFGAPLIDLTMSDLTTPGIVYQIGVPPSRIDILTSISGVTFEQAWARRLTVEIEGTSVPILGKEEFIVNKRAVGRPKDLSDLELLAEADRKS